MPAAHQLVVPNTDDPAEMFGYLWPQIETQISAIRSEPWTPSKFKEYSLFADLLAEHHKSQLPTELINYLNGGTNALWGIPPNQEWMRAFLFMRALDRAARRIVPAAVTVAAGIVSPSPGFMMEVLRNRWRIDGRLARTDAGQITFKGPLTAGRRAEDPEACNGDNFRDQFVNLAFMPNLKAGREISLKAVLPSEYNTGQDPIDRIGIAPIAEDGDDLAFKTEVRSAVCFIDAKPKNAALLAERTVKVVLALLDEGANLIVLPELVMSPEAVKAVTMALSTRVKPKPALVVLGSGLSENPASGSTLHYNEAVVLDSKGREIFRQRKIHHYNMAIKRLKKCSLSPAANEDHLENTATGNVLEIRDLIGIGRMMVLICEDLAQPDPGHEAAITLRPDWIITPVLDIPQRAGRWPQAKALSFDSGARVVVSGSATLGVRYKGLNNYAELDPVDGLGLMIDGADQGVYVVTKGTKDRDAYYTVNWDSSSWDESKLTTSPRKKPI